MSPERWKKLHELFEQAAVLPPHERAEFLYRACGDDVEFRAELQSLLEHHEQASVSFLKSPTPFRPTHSAFESVKNEISPRGPDPETAAQNAEYSRHRPANVIDGYEILQELSRGGQGVVFRAFQKSTKRDVAIKVLVEGAYASKSARRRFEREIELVARLNHPNIVQVFDSGITKEGQQYCVMDYVRGMPLDSFVRERKLTLEDALKLFVAICDAVNYAHQRGVIHRDLKPSNILVDGNGNPKVLDFGLAKALIGPKETLVSLTGQVFGTLPYMSPEQAKGSADEIDIRTDVYSLGVILYEILTGQYPYPVVGQLAEVLKHIAETLPTPPSRIWKSGSGISRRSTRRLKLGACPIDDEVQTIVLRSLAKERERRYQSAGELAGDVEHYLKHEPIEAKRDSALYVLRKLTRRHAYATTLLGLAACTMISTAFISLYSYRLARGEATRNEDLAKQVLKQSHTYEVLAAKAQEQVRRMTLGWFLLEWHANALQLARQNRDQTPTDSVESKAMQFLLDPTYSEKRLLEELPASASGLGYFVVGERYLKARRPADAQRAYESSLTLAREVWLTDIAKARLEQLRSSAHRDGPSVSGSDGRDR